MKKNIYSNIKKTDALESFFECITSCSINSEGVDCTTACYTKHLEPNNIDFPYKFLWEKEERYIFNNLRKKFNNQEISQKLHKVKF